MNLWNVRSGDVDITGLTGSSNWDLICVWKFSWVCGLLETCRFLLHNLILSEIKTKQQSTKACFGQQGSCFPQVPQLQMKFVDPWAVCSTYVRKSHFIPEFMIYSFYSASHYECFYWSRRMQTFESWLPRQSFQISLKKSNLSNRNTRRIKLL